MRREEIEICRRFDLLLATSDREAEIIRSWGAPRVETMANTIDAGYFTPREPPGQAMPRLAFVGATHVDANRDGLRWFMAEAFPLIREQVPDVALDIVGGDPSHELRAFGSIPGVTVTGYVKDVRDYMAARHGAHRALAQRRGHPAEDPGGPQLRRPDRVDVDRCRGPRPGTGRAPLDR